MSYGTFLEPLMISPYWSYSSRSLILNFFEVHLQFFDFFCHINIYSGFFWYLQLYGDVFKLLLIDIFIAYVAFATKFSHLDSPKAYSFLSFIHKVIFVLSTFPIVLWCLGEQYTQLIFFCRPILVSCYF
jgi:hypothetical protein